MRLIDADALLERIMDINSWYLYNEWGSETEFHKLIDEAPTIEPRHLPDYSYEADMVKRLRNNTDLISRADAIKGIRKCKFESDMPSYWYRGMEDAQGIIENIPSADAIHSVGVFVPNMEMPKVCDYCLFHDSEWSWCKAKDKYCGDGKCPLIAVRGERREP